MVILGSIRKLTAFEMIVSLPNNLNGFVSIADISEPLSQLLSSKLQKGEGEESTPSLLNFFKEGQILQCYVTKAYLDASNKKKIQLSIKPSLVNAGLTHECLLVDTPVYGAVKSVEDHGYVITFGVDDKFTGFVATKDVIVTGPNDEPEVRPLSVGQPVWCLVKEAREKAVVVRIDDRAYAAALTKEDNVLAVSSLKAGMLVSGEIKKVLQTGLWVQFLGYFTGTIDIFHLNLYQLSDISNKYKEGNKIRARIIYVNYESKRVALSALPHIIHFEPFPFPAKTNIGDAFENAKVMRIEKTYGMVLQLPTEPEQRAFVHISRITDRRLNNIGDKFSVNQLVKCRVVGHNHLDGIVNVA